MKEVVYGYQIQQAPDLLRLAERGTVALDELLGPADRAVSAEWDASRDALGHPILTLRLQDFSGSVTTALEPKEFAEEGHLRLRLNRLLLELLEIRVAQRLRELHEAGVLEGV
jgi:hypothetical protein